MSKHDSPAPLEKRTAYRLGYVTYLPHYTKPVYVGPGYPEHNNREYTKEELLAAGAEPVDMFLLRRGPDAPGKME